MDDDESGLFNIDISPPSSPASSSEKLPRDHQSEEDWKRQKAEWRPKVEVGEIWKTLTLPIDKPSKQVSQTILHAIEELYFFARYEEALKFTEEALKGNLEEGFKKTVVEYKGRCEAKIKTYQS